jgi:hypothetical protein
MNRPEGSLAALSLLLNNAPTCLPCLHMHAAALVVRAQCVTAVQSACLVRMLTAWHTVIECCTPLTSNPIRVGCMEPANLDVPKSVRLSCQLAWLVPAFMHTLPADQQHWVYERGTRRSSYSGSSHCKCFPRPAAGSVSTWGYIKHHPGDAPYPGPAKRAMLCWHSKRRQATPWPPMVVTSRA